MLKKFFLQIIIIALIVIFFGLNFETKVDIKFWFSEKMTLVNVSFFIALAVAYILGVLSFIPFYIGKLFNNKKKSKQIEPDE